MADRPLSSGHDCGYWGRLTCHTRAAGGRCGFKISWIGFHGKGKVGALKAAGLRETGEPDEANEAPFSGAEIPDGWFVLFSNDFAFVSPERLARLSVDCRIVACQIHEGIMFSAAYGYERGSRVWELVHQSRDDLSRQRHRLDLPCLSDGGANARGQIGAGALARLSTDASLGPMAVATFGHLCDHMCGD